MTLVDDIAYEVDGKRIRISNGIEDRLIGGNPSAEEPTEGAEDTSDMVIDVVYSMRLVQTGFHRKAFQETMKAFCKAIVEKLKETKPERVDVFKSGVNTLLRNVIKSLKEYEFYTGASMNPEGLVVLQNYREDGITPYFIFLKDALEEVKY